MSPMGDKKRQVSESFGSSSVASLRTPPTWFHRVRACAGENDFTSSDRRPIRPHRPPEHPPLLGHTRLPPKRSNVPIGLVTAKQTVVTACLTRQWWCMGETHVRFVRSSPRHRERSWVGAPIKDNPFAARRPLTHRRTFSRFRGSYSPP